MSDKAKQKLNTIIDMIVYSLLPIGFCGAMVMNRMELTGQPASSEWKTALVVFQIVTLIVAVIKLRLTLKEDAEKKKEYSKMTDAEMFAINKAAMDKFLAGHTDSGHGSRDAPLSPPD